MTLKGRTTDFPLEVVLRMLAEQKKTGELSIRSAGGEGALGVAEGRVVTAVFGDEAAIPALGAIFKLSEADFEFTPWADAPPANLEGDLQDNLRKATEYAEWLASVRQVVPDDRLRFRLSEKAAEAGAVTFTSDRWRVVLAVNGQRDVNDLAAHLHLERDAALTTLSGLVRDGVIETIAPGESPAPNAPSAPPAQQMSAPSAPAAPEPVPPPPAEDSDWTAALLRKAAAAETAPSPAAPAPHTAGDWGPATPAPEPAPAPAAPMPQEWGPPAPATEPAPAPAAPMPQEWGIPAPEPAQLEVEPAAPMPRDWGTPAPEPPAAEPAAAAPQDWAPPVPAQPAQPAQPAEPAEPAEAAELAMSAQAAPEPEPEAAPPPLDDRLAALQKAFDPPEAQEPAAPADQWTAPAADWNTPAPAADSWTAPAPAEPVAPAVSEHDAMRLNALSAPPPAQEAVRPANEWLPPPEVQAPPPQKKGILGGLFRREDAEPETAGRTTVVERGGSSRAGLLAAFSNALITEYNSGHYGKGRVEERIPSLLMRVDEQADPIDKPLPVMDERLDVQSLERISMPDAQVVPYLALLVSTIYGDAEKAFGRDKAKRGYRAAQQHVFGGDTAALGGTDVAGKLPKI